MHVLLKRENGERERAAAVGKCLIGPDSGRLERMRSIEQRREQEEATRPV